MSDSSTKYLALDMDGGVCHCVHFEGWRNKVSSGIGMIKRMCSMILLTAQTLFTSLSTFSFLLVTKNRKDCLVSRGTLQVKLCLILEMSSLVGIFLTPFLRSNVDDVIFLCLYHENKMQRTLINACLLFVTAPSKSVHAKINHYYVFLFSQFLPPRGTRS